MGLGGFGSSSVGSSCLWLTYITYLQPWDYAAASILGESLGYRLLTVSGEPADFKTRQPVMMVPIEMQEEIQSYIYERKEN